MNKEVPIIREINESDDEYFPQTHVTAVIGIEDLIESYLITDIILKSPSGKQFKLVVDDKGVLNAQPLEGTNT
ncbi:hypothetical protein [Staphylococcus kloosii]|uniref:hypothetical protein n=1 Tax=Staphylococcus kloosii TaxID=29384 RepID=UPI0028A37AB6|nr:hypothetical protein [Staphylococcus kloosii]MDT3959541.1 hypothetical protein [Staphylococcus kloosii]